jgi:predicted porin
MAFASTANAGITIPAGDWTVDIGGVVNAYYTDTRVSGRAVSANGASAVQASTTVNNITTGLLPNYLTVSGKTRQNDLDVAFTISIQPGAATSTSATLGSLNQRQAFFTVGDSSWGSVKFGKDLGIYASDAILNDMTLLGVGQGAAAVGNTTLGGIGAGYMYADWKSQIAYSSPNWNGFQFTAGVTQAWDATSSIGNLSSGSAQRGGSESAYEGKVSYSFAANDVTGKVWASGFTQKVKGLADDRANAWDIGANVNYAGFGLTGYYGQGEGTGTTFLLQDGFDRLGKKRDSDDWYVQATYVLPTQTKVGVSYGESNLDGTSAAGGDNNSSYSNQKWTVGAYHPLTKSVNLVAEYSNVDTEGHVTGVADATAKAKTVSLGAILFF